MPINFTLIIIGITCVISYICFSNYELKHKLMFNPYSVKHRGEFYRFISHGFVHGDMSHLFINMFVLWQFGGFLESTFSIMFGPALSTVAFIFFYLSAVVVSSISSYMRHGDNPNYNSVGASGATSAMVFAFIIFQPWQWFIFPPVPALILAVGYLYYSSYMDKRQADNIGHNAHFWGAVYGFIFVMGALLILNPMLSDSVSLLDVVWNRFTAGPEMPGFLGGGR